MDGVRTEEKTLADDDGRINAGQTKHKDQQFAKALETGLRWLMVKKEAEGRWPKLQG